MGAKKVILCDIQQSRLDFCKKLIPSMSVINTKDLSLDQVVEQVKAANGGKLCDSSIDCAGVDVVVGAAIKVTKNGGGVCLVGMGKPEMNIPILNASCREVDLFGVVCIF